LSEGVKKSHFETFSDKNDSQLVGTAQKWSIFDEKLIIFWLKTTKSWSKVVQNMTKIVKNSKK